MPAQPSQSYCFGLSEIDRLVGWSVGPRHAYGGAGCGWGEWVTLSAKYCDLTADAQLALTVRNREEVADSWAGGGGRKGGERYVDCCERDGV